MEGRVSNIRSVTRLMQVHTTSRNVKTCQRILPLLIRKTHLRPLYLGQLTGVVRGCQSPGVSSATKKLSRLPGVSKDLVEPLIMSLFDIDIVFRGLRFDAS